jgi:hypothetical protein
MVDNRITKERIRHHLAYGWWKYLLLLALTLVVWDLVFTTTAYRPAADKKLDIYVVTPGALVDQMQADMLTDIAADFPDQEEVRFLHIALGSDNDYAATMQFTTWVAAQQGDLFLLEASRFRDLCTQDNGGLFLPLDDWIASGALSQTGLEAFALRLTDAEGRRAVYGISAVDQYGLLTRYGVDNAGMVWAIPSYTGNAQGAARMLAWLSARLTEEKPAGYDAYRQETDRQQQVLPTFP